MISSHQLGMNTDCMVRNLSDGGACLSVGNPLLVPNQFKLVIGHHMIKRCEVVWRNADRIGVAFQHGGSAAP